MKRNNQLVIWLALAGLAVLVGMGCAGSRRLITSNGVHALQLGQALPEPGTARLRGHSIRDTFVEQGDYQWREVVVEYRKGRVYLEEDFYGSEHLSRVRVCTPELRTRTGLRVGMPVSELLAKASDWTLVPLPEYDLLDAYSRTMPRLHFIIDDPAIPKDRSWDEYKLEEVSPTAVIEMIVVF